MCIFQSTTESIKRVKTVKELKLTVCSPPQSSLSLSPAWTIVSRFVLSLPAHCFRPFQCFRLGFPFQSGANRPAKAVLHCSITPCGTGSSQPSGSTLTGEDASFSTVLFLQRCSFTLRLYHALAPHRHTQLVY